MHLLARRSTFSVVALVCLLHGVARAGEAADTSREAAELVRKMSGALRTLTYEGTFVHLAGGSLSSMSIVHTNAGDGERERLSSLDGEAREIVRDRSLVTCIWPDSRSVVVSDSKPRTPLPAIDASLTDNASYALSVSGTDRVAGVETRVVDVMPHDALRYGYRFWIDVDTYMLLRSMLLDEMAQPVEQLLFTRIAYPDSIDPQRFAIGSGGLQKSWIDEELGKLPRASDDHPSVEPKAGTVGADGIDRVEFESLPDGYREVSETHRPLAIEAGPVSHVMLSDGMASVSVYVEHVPVERQDHSAAGASRMGAINAYGVALDEAFVTAVGEVPAETVRRIALAVRVAE